MGYRIFFAVIPHGIDLILHQGYEGRYDDSGAFAHKRGKLVAKRFAASRRHYYESIVTTQKTQHYGFLMSLEGIEAEMHLQCVAKLLLCHHGLVGLEEVNICQTALASKWAASS